MMAAGLRWVLRVAALAAGMAVFASGGLLALGLDWPLAVTRHLPPALLGLAESARDRLSAILIEDDWRDCSDTELFLKRGDGVALDLPSPARPETEVVIAAVGDVLLHSQLQRQGFEHRDGFRSLWHDVEPILAAADVAYANLEGPVSPRLTRAGLRAATVPDQFDGTVFSSYPLFNYPDDLLGALKRSGIDIVSTANNHALDRGWQGVDSTIGNVVAHGLQYTGTRPSAEPGAAWHTVTRTGKWRIAWLACTYGTNGIPDRKGQVLHCFDEKDQVLRLVAVLAKRKDVDAVIVTPHWGVQYVHEPTARQKAFARAAIEAGAVAVIGSHPHVVQPWELYRTGSGRRGLIMYSLGNFVSGQRGLARRSTLVLLLGLTDDGKGRLELGGARYVPLAMTFAGEARTGAITVQAIDRHRPHYLLNRNLLTKLLAPEQILPPGHPLTTIGPCLASPLKTS